MCQFDIKPGFYHHATRPPFRPAQHHVHVCIRTAAQQYKARLGGVHQRRQDFVDQLNTFLIGQTCDQTKQRSIRCDGQFHATDQIRFVGLLSGKFSGVIPGGQMFVGGRIPDLGIDTVDDAAQPWRHIGQHTVQSATPRFGLNFFCVGLAHRSHQIRRRDARLQTVDVAVIFKRLH